MSRSRASAKKAGTDFETKCAAFLSEKLHREITRMPKNGAADKGDLYGLEVHGYPAVGECKSPGKNSSWSLAGWWKETQSEMENLLAEYGFLMIKRFHKSTGESFCVVDDQIWEKINGGNYHVPVEMKSLPHSSWGAHIDNHTVISTPKRGVQGCWIIGNLDTFADIIYEERYIPHIQLTPSQQSMITAGDSIIAYDERGTEVKISGLPTS